jgi:hypothetical protein
MGTGSYPAPGGAKKRDDEARSARRKFHWQVFARPQNRELFNHHFWNGFCQNLFLHILASFSILNNMERFLDN